MVACAPSDRKPGYQEGAQAAVPVALETREEGARTQTRDPPKTLEQDEWYGDHP